MLDFSGITAFEVGLFLCWVSLWTWVVYTTLDHSGRIKSLERFSDKMDERIERVEDRHLDKDDLAGVRDEIAELRKQQAVLVDHLLRERRER